MSTDNAPLGEQTDKQSSIQTEDIAAQHRHAQESGEVFDEGPAGRGDTKAKLRYRSNHLNLY